jgi:hypothetical protein
MAGKLRMSLPTRRHEWLLACLVIVSAVTLARGAEPWPDPSYRAIYGWEKMPAGMKLGVVSGIFPDPDGSHLWVLSRCGGIRIGDARTGRVTHVIPDMQSYGDGESGVEFLAADAMGNIYAGEVTRQRLVKFVPAER